MLGFCNAALLLHTPHILCVFPPSCFLTAPALRRRLLPGDAFSLGDAFFFATLSLGDAFSWRRLLSWRRFLLATPSFLATPPFLATPVAASNGKKIKTKNQGKVLFELLFFFYSGDLIKKPPKGKKSVPFNKIVTWLLT